MPDTTIQIPAEHVEAIHQSLIGLRHDGQRAEGVEDLLGQIASASSGGSSCELTGPRAVLWSAIYEALCVAAEQLADACNEYWRGTVDPESARARVSSVGARLELLVALGAPPGR